MTDDPVIGMDAVLKSDVFCTLTSGTEVAGYTVAVIFKGMHSLEVSPGGRKGDYLPVGHDDRREESHTIIEPLFRF